MRCIYNICLVSKIIPLCPALIHAFTTRNRVDADSEWYGGVFEAAAVGAHLCTAFDNVNYWRDGAAEVDIVIEIETQVIAIEVKSGRRKSPLGLMAFKKKFPRSKTVLMDYEPAERLLLSRSPKKFVGTLLM